MNVDRSRQSISRDTTRIYMNNNGQTLIEYVLIVVVIALVVITAMKIFQGDISTTYTNAATSIRQAP